MGFIEFVGTLIIIAIAVAFWLGVAAAAVTGAILGLTVVLALGWIPILMCATDYDWMISFSGTFIESAAAWSVLAYLVAGGGLAILWLTVPDADQLPHGLKMLAFLFPHPAEPHVKHAISTGQPVDAGGMVEAMRAHRPQSRTEDMMRAHNADNLRRDVEAEARRRRADAELAEATVEMERARARAEEARKRRDKL